MAGVELNEDRRMNFELPIPSLQRLALIKIAAAMFNWDVVVNMADMFISPHHGRPIRIDAEEWKGVEATVEAKVLTLPLPTLLQTEIKNLIMPLRKEISEWIDFHYREYRERRDDFPMRRCLLPKQFCWSMHGTVDYKKTAALMLKDERLDIKSRYQLACVNCLEEEGREIIKVLDRKTILESMNIKSTGVDMICFFTYTLASRYNAALFNYYRPRELNSQDDLERENIKLFVAAISKGNRAICEYLYSKWNQEERGRYINNILDLVFDDFDSCLNGSSICILSVTSEVEQLENAIRSHKAEVLVCLLDWPMQPLFMEAAKNWWSLMSTVDHGNVFHSITFMIINDFRDYDYAGLFWECWQLSSSESKQKFLDYFYSAQRLIQTKQEKFIRLAFKEAPSKSIKKLCDEFFYQRVEEALWDRNVISDAALMELKEEAESNSSDDQPDEEKRMRNQYLGQLLVMVVKSRSKKQVDKLSTSQKFW